MTLLALEWGSAFLFFACHSAKKVTVTHTWKNAPQQLSKKAGTAIMISSLVFYALLWTMFSLLITSSQVRKLFPIQQACFVFFLYIMCCLAESMLKNTSTKYSAMDEATTTRLEKEASQPQEESYTSIDGTKWKSSRYLNTIMDMSDPPQNKKMGTLFLSLFVSIMYCGVVLGIHLYSPQVRSEANGSVIAYITVVAIVQSMLCFVILYPLSQVALRLSVRSKVARLFQESVSYSQADYAFRLDSLDNIRAWQFIRDTLLRRYAFPTMYVDVVISAAFTLWVPLVIVGVMEFFFQLSITPLAINTTTLAVLVLIYLLVCVMTAAEVQEVLSNTQVLRWQEYHFLVSEKQGEYASLTTILKRLSLLIEQGRDGAIVFQVWGFPLNRGMSTFLGGVLVTLASSIFVRVASVLT